MSFFGHLQISFSSPVDSAEMRFIDLFSGLGGFHSALAQLGHECVFASELDPELRQIYRRNYPETRQHVFGDIREAKKQVPPHDILCAGFPCQPFSKSGAQMGLLDETRGTLFHEIVEILHRHHPHYVILENVGNFERHDGGRTWRIVQEKLGSLGYTVRGTTHKASGGHGLISPHHFGHPHHRERFFIVASKAALAEDPFPRGNRLVTTSLDDIVEPDEALDANERVQTALSQQQVECIGHWNKLLNRLPLELPIPSTPLWGDEIGAAYEFEDTTPYASAREELRAQMTESHPAFWEQVQERLAHLPRYAQAEEFPRWKKNFIRTNRAWFTRINEHLDEEWIGRLHTFPPSLRKLEWNCQGEPRDLWRYVLQFRPSGLRAKRYTSIPALVAMTTTQIPILGPRRRFLTRVEGLLLQGFPATHELPSSRERAFAALGNAVHVSVVKAIVNELLVDTKANQTLAQQEVQLSLGAAA